MFLQGILATEDKLASSGQAFMQAACMASQTGQKYSEKNLHDKLQILQYENKILLDELHFCYFQKKRLSYKKNLLIDEKKKFDGREKFQWTRISIHYRSIKKHGQRY